MKDLNRNAQIEIRNNVSEKSDLLKNTLYWVGT